MKIIKCVMVAEKKLVVYYTSSKCYQFAIISPLGIQKYDSIFYTAEGAEREGRRSLMSDD